MPREVWPPYRTVRSLVHGHAGRAAVVLGGGPSLLKHIDAAPLDALYLSVNDHGVRLFKDRPKLARVCHLVVACDKIEERARGDVGRDHTDRQRRAADGQPWGLPVISRHMWADYRLPFMPAPSSGMSAAWLARYLGCSPIILMGMDLYNGATYWDAKDATSTGTTITDKSHFQRWMTLFKRFPGPYRTLGCHPLLQKQCAQYDAQEPPSLPIERHQLINELQSAWCQLTRDVPINQRPFNAGQILELGRAEVDNLVKQRKAVRVKPGEV